MLILLLLPNFLVDSSGDPFRWEVGRRIDSKLTFQFAFRPGHDGVGCSGGLVEQEGPLDLILALLVTGLRLRN